MDACESLSSPTSRHLLLVQSAANDNVHVDDNQCFFRFPFALINQKYNLPFADFCQTQPNETPIDAPIEEPSND
ncbi:hypothetical protein BLOT_012667 [Blomia tropicalis]|nr:hypothetical protein BLOT_012667 [Blomia tropicalis]